eukprot:jgi/Psemu1/14596/gm1.14596_g
MALPNDSLLTKIPPVYFYKHCVYGHQDDTHMVSTNKIPRLMPCKNSDPSAFRLIPVNSWLDPSVIETKDRICTRLEFWKAMVATEEFKYVAIRCEDGKFLSCGRSNVGFATYHETISEKEIFTVKYHDETDCFSFRSFDGQYLGTKAGRIVGFQSEPMNHTIGQKSLWEIVCTLCSPLGDPRVEFVGVANGFKYEMMRAAKDSKIEKITIERFHSNLFGDVLTGPKQSRIFFNQFRGMRYFYFRPEENLGFVLVATLKFSAAVAGECLQELADIYCSDYHNNIKGDRIQLQKIESDLSDLMWRYDWLEEKTNYGVANIAKKAIEISSVAEESVMHGERTTAAETGELSILLQEQCKAFAKRANKEKRKVRQKNLAIASVTGGTEEVTVEGVVVSLLGEPTIATILSTQAVDTAAEIIIRWASNGGLIGVGDAACNEFWKYYACARCLSTRRNQCLWRMHENNVQRGNETS